MDCVGCEKCRLWGKLQILGIGTAIKVLLMTPPTRSPTSSSSCDHNIDAQELNDEKDGKGLVLNRQEVIALLNTLNQLSKSIVFASRIMAQRADDREIEEIISLQEEDKSPLKSTDPIMELRTDASSSAMYLMKKRVGTNKLNIKAKAKTARNNASSTKPQF